MLFFVMLFAHIAQATSAQVGTACAMLLKPTAQVHNLSPVERQAVLESGLKFPAQVQLELERSHEFLKGRTGQVRYVLPLRDDSFYNAMLSRLGIAMTMDQINLRLREPHRHFHIRDVHVNELLNFIESVPNLSDYERDELRVAALFHNIIYKPQSSRNEEDSAELLLANTVRGADSDHIIIKAVRTILESQGQNNSQSNRQSNEQGSQRSTFASTYFQNINMQVLTRPYAELLEWEHSLFNENQSMDWLTYRAQRIEYLQARKVGTGNEAALDQLIDYLRHWQPRIAVFAGSFNPLHIGHYALIIEAERHFDKVIVARGVNPAKVVEKEFGWDLALTLPNHQTAEYQGFLTTFMRGLGYPVTLLRGIRNGHDMEAEQTQISLMRAQMPELLIMPVLADAAYDHISSTAYRMLRKLEDAEGTPPAHATSWQYLVLGDYLRLQQ